MLTRKPPPGRAPRTAATGLSKANAATDIIPDCKEQAQVEGAARLVERVVRRRRVLLERGAALRLAYAALRRADDLRACNELLDAAMIALDALAENRADLAMLLLFERCAGLEGEP